MLLLFLPVRIALVVAWDASEPLFDLRLWGFSLRRTRPPRFLRRWGTALLDRLLAPSPDRGRKDQETSGPAPRRPGRWKIDLPELAGAALRAMGRFLGAFTRRLEVSLGGTDPALLGVLTGTCGGVAAAFGVRRFRWLPDFGATSFRLRLEWHLSISLFGILRWAVGSAPALAAAVRRRKDPGLLPSAS